MQVKDDFFKPTTAATTTITITNNNICANYYYKYISTSISKKVQVTNRHSGSKVINAFR
jgi:hypothetical protein